MLQHKEICGIGAEYIQLRQPFAVVLKLNDIKLYTLSTLYVVSYAKAQRESLGFCSI